MTLRQALGETHLQGWGAEDWVICKMAVTKKEDGNAGTPEGSRAGASVQGQPLLLLSSQQGTCKLRVGEWGG